MAEVQAEVVGNVMEQPPAQVEMEMGEGVMLYQKTSQCCRCCCCQPNIDWTIHDHSEHWDASMELPIKMFIKEDAPYCGRCMSHCWPAFRATRYTVHQGQDETGSVLFTHEKPVTCSHCPLVLYGDNGPVRIPWCCCLPYLETKDANGQVLGKTKYVCDLKCCVPKYDVLDKDDNKVYRIRPDTCCIGLCPKCRCGGGSKGKCFRIPFPIRKPEPPFDQINDAAITDLWAGMKHECCTNREMYAVKFPQDPNQKDPEAMKKVLIGSALLIDITLNEQDQ